MPGAKQGSPPPVLLNTLLGAVQHGKTPDVRFEQLIRVLVREMNTAAKNQTLGEFTKTVLGSIPQQWTAIQTVGGSISETAGSGSGT
jgi:hypothetical protein